MRPVKLIALILGGLVALVVIAVIAVVLLVDPNDYKDRIAQEVKAATGRDLVLSGDLKLSIFPWLAIETGPAELGNREGFGPGPFVTLEAADVGVKLLPLLRGELVVRRLLIDGMQVNLVKNADGRTNWEDLTGGEEGQAQPQQPQAPAEPKKLPTIAGLTIRDSALDYRDLQEGSRTRLQKLEVETGRLGGGDPVDLTMSFVLDEGPDTPNTTVKLETQLAADMDAERYTLKDLVLNAVHRTVGKDASELPLELRAPSLEADLAAQTLALPQFELGVLGAKVTGELEGSKIVDAPAFEGRIALEQTSLRDLLPKLGMEVPKTSDPEALKSVALTSRIEATDTSVLLEDLDLSLDGSKITGRAGVNDLEKMALEFDLTADKLNLDRYLEPEPEEPKGKGAATEPVELPVDLLRTLNARGTLAVGTLQLAGMTLQQVKLKLDAADGVVRVNPSQAQLFGGSHYGTLAIDARGPVAKIALDEKLSGIDFARLFAELFESKRLKGKGEAKAVLSARGNDLDAILASLDGRIDFNVANGALVGADLWYEIRRARALWKREEMPAGASLGETPFKALRGTAKVTQGVVSNDDLVIDMDYLKVAGEGKLDLKSGKVDYRLTARVYEMAPAQQPEGQAAPTQTELEDLRKAEIPVRVAGTLDDLSVRPDIQQLAKAQVKEKVEEKKEELKKKVTDRLSDWLGNKKP